MISINQLLHIIIFLYLGFFTHIAYSTLMFYQKRIRLLKAIVIFILISIIIIKITYKYSISINPILSIIYVVGIILSFNLFENYLYILNTKYYSYLTIFISKLKYTVKLISIPPIYYYVKCKFYTLNYYRKHKWLKPIGIKRLF